MGICESNPEPEPATGWTLDGYADWMIFEPANRDAKFAPRFGPHETFLVIEGLLRILPREMNVIIVQYFFGECSAVEVTKPIWETGAEKGGDAYKSALISCGM